MEMFSAKGLLSVINFFSSDVFKTLIPEQNRSKSLGKYSLKPYKTALADQTNIPEFQ